MGVVIHLVPKPVHRAMADGFQRLAHPGGNAHRPEGPAGNVGDRDRSVRRLFDVSAIPPKVDDIFFFFFFFFFFAGPPASKTTRLMVDNVRLEGSEE